MRPFPTNIGSFSGTLDGAPIGSVSAEITRAGTEPYLLIGLEGGFILDIGKISANGPSHPVVLVDPENQRFTGQCKAPVVQESGGLRLDLSTVSLTRTGSDQTHTITGTAQWHPSASAEEWQGELRLRSAERLLPAIDATLHRFNDGWLLISAVPLDRGHTLSVHLTTVPPALQLIETRLIAGDLTSRHPDLRALSVRVVVDPESGPVEIIVVRFTAEVDDGVTGFSTFIGQFTATA